MDERFRYRGQIYRVDRAMEEATAELVTELDSYAQHNFALSHVHTDLVDGKLRIDRLDGLGDAGPRLEGLEYERDKGADLWRAVRNGRIPFPAAGNWQCVDSTCRLIEHGDAPAEILFEIHWANDDGRKAVSRWSWRRPSVA